jgi:uncharacterized YkwD family protein
MIQINKSTIIVFIVIGLLMINILPALATFSSPTTKIYYFNPDSYDWNYEHYSQPTSPLPPVVNLPAKPTEPSVDPIKPPLSPTPAPVSSLTDEESRMVELVNRERTSINLKPLSVNMRLVTLARLKSQDMVKNNYLGHTSPTYGSPFDMMKKAGVKYSTAGENIAGGASAEIANHSLMNSPGHRANILDPSFNQLGIGIAQGSKYGNIFTQLFIGN